MPYPINPAHRLLLEDNVSYLLLEDNTSKLILDEQIALDDPLNAGTVSTVTPALTFVGEDLPTGGNLTYEVEVDTVNTFDSVQGTISRITGQDATGTGSTGATATYASTPTAGNLLIAAVVDNAGSGVPATLTDWTVALFKIDSSATNLLTVYYKVASGAESTSVTVTNIGAGVVDIAIYEYQGFLGTSTLDQKVSTTNTGTPTQTGTTPTTLHANELLFAAVAQATNSTVTSWSNSFTARNNVSATPMLATADQVVSSTGAYSTAATLNPGTSRGVGAIATFYNAGSPLLDKTSDLNIGFVDDTTTALGDDRLLLEDNVSYLLLEDNSSKLAINYDYPSGDYVSYTVPAATLSNGVTYYWRARQKVQNGGSYTSWSEIRSFTVSSGASITITQVAASVIASGGTQAITSVQNAAITQLAATVTASGGTQLAQTNSSNAQVAATVTAAGGTESIATVNIVSITQVAGVVTASGGTQAIATVNNVAISQVAGTVTATGGTDSIATVNNIAITQVAGTVTASGGTDTIATINNVSVAQSAGTVTASGGTQTITTLSNVAIAQVAATVTASGGTEVIATVNKVAIAQVAATVTASGGVQSVATSNFVAISQIAATVTATGGTQVIASSNFVAIAQTAASVTATGGTQSIGSVISASVTQVAGVVTASGGTQIITISSGSTFKKEVYLLNGNPATRIGTANKRVIMLQNGSFALKIQPNIYLPL